MQIPATRMLFYGFTGTVINKKQLKLFMTF